MYLLNGKDKSALLILKLITMRTTITTKTAKNETLKINIRCDDECKNGHDSFAITGTLWEANKPLTDRNTISSGCIHDVIGKTKKSLQPFIDLHLSDGDGVPMYAVENGYYYYSAQYPDAATWFNTLQEYLRIDSDECHRLVNEMNAIHTEAERKAYFTAYVELCKPRWKQEAEAAQTLLKQLIDNNK